MSRQVEMLWCRSLGEAHQRLHEMGLCDQLLCVTPDSESGFWLVLRIEQAILEAELLAHPRRFWVGHAGFDNERRDATRDVY